MLLTVVRPPVQAMGFTSFFHLPSLKMMASPFIGQSLFNVIRNFRIQCMWTPKEDGRSDTRELEQDEARKIVSNIDYMNSPERKEETTHETVDRSPLRIVLQDMVVSERSPQVDEFSLEDASFAATSLYEVL